MKNKRNEIKMAQIPDEEEPLESEVEDEMDDAMTTF